MVLGVDKRGNVEEVEMACADANWPNKKLVKPDMLHVEPEKDTEGPR